jgi:hypothetical protein
MQIKVLAMFLFLVAVALPIAAFADPVTATNDSNFTFSTRTIYDTTNATASQQVNTFAVELIASMQGGTTLYDQTFNVAFADPAVQAAIITVQGVLTANGAASFNGPFLLTDSTSQVGSVAQTGAPVVTGTDVSSAATGYVGPQTIMIGDNQSQAFTLLTGQTDIDTLVTSIIHQIITTTTTDTFLTTDVYQIFGVPAEAAPVPEPATLLLVAMGGPAVLFFRGRKRRKDSESRSGDV